MVVLHWLALLALLSSMVLSCECIRSFASFDGMDDVEKRMLDRRDAAQEAYNSLILGNEQFENEEVLEKLKALRPYSDEFKEGFKLPCSYGELIEYDRAAADKCSRLAELEKLEKLVGMTRQGVHGNLHGYLADAHRNQWILCEKQLLREFPFLFPKEGKLIHNLDEKAGRYGFYEDEGAANDRQLRMAILQTIEAFQYQGKRYINFSEATHEISQSVKAACKRLLEFMGTDEEKIIHPTKEEMERLRPIKLCEHVKRFDFRKEFEM